MGNILILSKYVVSRMSVLGANFDLHKKTINYSFYF